MPLPPFLRRPAVPLASVALLAAVALPGLSTTAVATPTRPALPLPAVASLQTVRIEVPSALDSAPFDKARSVHVPQGWTVKVVARPKKARLEVPTPDGRLLVSRPEYGLVTRLTPNKRGYPTSSTLVKGLRKPHGMAFDGNTLYVAESNRIDRYTYKDGKVGKRSTVLSGLPDCRARTSRARTPTRSRAWRSARTTGCTSRSARPRTPRPPTATSSCSGPRSSRSRRASRATPSSRAACATAPGSRSPRTATSGPR